jgi:hypothetical protein
MGGRSVHAFFVVAWAFVACGESQNRPRVGDGTLVLEVGGVQPSLREALRSAGVEVATPAPAVATQDQPVVPQPRPQPQPTGEPPPSANPRPNVPPPDEPPFFVVEMKAGDSLILLARRHLGDSNRFRELLTLNGWSEEDAPSLRAGTKVRIPGRAASNSAR